IHVVQFGRKMETGPTRENPPLIVVCNRLLNFFKVFSANLMTVEKKKLGVGNSQGVFKPAPKNDARNEAGENEKAKAEDGTRPPQDAPYFQDERTSPVPQRRPRSVGCRHRRPPERSRVRRVSISTKSFSTGG